MDKEQKIDILTNGFNDDNESECFICGIEDMNCKQGFALVDNIVYKHVLVCPDCYMSDDEFKAEFGDLIQSQNGGI